MERTQTTDDQRIFDALRFYLERVTWSSADPEQTEYKRLLEEYAQRTLASR